MKDGKGLTRRDFLYLAGLGVAGTALAGPSESRGAEKKPKYGGRLRVGYRYNASGLDAHKNQDFAEYTNYCLMYGALTEQGKLPQVELHPMLAKSWEISKDGREYLFPLREGVKFHHGKELDSGDVKYSIDRVMNPATRSPRAFAFRWVDSVSVIDKYHLKIRLKEPFAPFLTCLTLNYCPIIPAGWEPAGTKPAPGTGPFVFKSIVPNETTEYTRFDKYYEINEETGDRLPYLDSILVRKIVDENIRLTALRAGDVDAISQPPLNVLAKAMTGQPLPGIVMDYINVGVELLWFNVTKPPFDNKKVRQAVAYALDKQEIHKAVYWGLGETVNNQPFLKLSRLYIPVEDRKTDLAKARQLLAEAGYPNGFKTELFGYSINTQVAGAEVISGQLRKIGIDASMKVIDRAPYYSAIRKGDYNVSYSSYDEKYDWDDGYYMFFHSSEIGRNNWSRYSNKEVDALLEKGRVTLTHEEREQIYKKVVEILREEVPVVYVSKTVVGNGLRDYVKGYRKGFGVRFAWYGGGTKYWWIDK